MKLEDRDNIAAAPMALAWRRAAADLGFRFESPFAMEHGAATIWCSGWLPDFGGPRGAVIVGRYEGDEAFDVCDALGYWASGLSPFFYENYDREQFMETLNDWGWFGPAAEAPAWFVRRVGRHGGPA